MPSSEQFGPRESMAYDVVVVGAGPAGLATAIRLKQLAAEKGSEVSVVVLEKGSEPGAHILSGAIMDPRGLSELFPNWKDIGAPLNQPVTSDKFLFLSETGARATPDFLLPGCFKNHANYIVSLGNVVKWNMGIGRDGVPTENFQLGMELHAKYTVVAEGCRGHLGRQLIDRFRLADGRDPHRACQPRTTSAARTRDYRIVRHSCSRRPSVSRRLIEACAIAGRWAGSDSAPRIVGESQPHVGSGR